MAFDRLSTVPLKFKAVNKYGRGFIFTKSHTAYITDTFSVRIQNPRKYSGEPLILRIDKIDSSITKSLVIDKGELTELPELARPAGVDLLRLDKEIGNLIKKVVSSGIKRTIPASHLLSLKFPATARLGYEDTPKIAPEWEHEFSTKELKQFCQLLRAEKPATVDVYVLDKIAIIKSPRCTGLFAGCFKER